MVSMEMGKHTSVLCLLTSADYLTLSSFTALPLMTPNDHQPLPASLEKVSSPSLSLSRSLSPIFPHDCRTRNVGSTLNSEVLSPCIKLASAFSFFADFTRTIFILLGVVMDGVRLYYYVVANGTMTEVCLGNCSLVVPLSPGGQTSPPSVHYGSPSLPPPFSHQNILSDILTVVVALLSAAFLLVSFYITMIRCCNRRNSSVRALQRQNPPVLDEVFEGQDLINHFWYINTVGLEESLINSITFCKFKRGEGLIEGTDCSVCLSEFQEGEDLRLLPKCSHAFHSECIDRWLRAHVNCPLCRAPIMASNENPSPPGYRPAGASVVDRAHVEESGAGGANDNEHNGDSVFVSIELANIEDPIKGGDLGAVGALAGQSSSNQMNGVVMAEKTVDEVQSIRRSASMNSLARIHVSTAPGTNSAREFSSFAYGSMVGVGSSDSDKMNWRELVRFEGAATEDGGGSSGERALGDVAKGRGTQKIPFHMKRSFSISGNFFSRNNGRNRSSVLPL